MKPALLRENKTLITVGLLALTLLVLVALVTIGSMTFEAYERSIATLHTQNNTLQIQLDKLQKKIDVSTQQSKAAAQLPPYSITMGKYIRQAANPYEDLGIDTLFLYASIKNTSQQQQYINSADIQLKDSQNQAYVAHTSDGVGSYPKPYPGGLQPLATVTIQPGQTIAGTLVFTIPTKVNNFTLIYNTVEVAVAVK